MHDVNITKEKGFGEFNLAGKWKKNYRGFQTKEPWYILTNLGDLETAIIADQKRFDNEYGLLFNETQNLIRHCHIKGAK